MNGDLFAGTLLPAILRADDASRLREVAALQIFIEELKARDAVISVAILERCLSDRRAELRRRGYIC